MTLGIDFWGQQPYITWLSLPQLWLWFLCHAFRIYLDFSGYSDMVIGLARMMGIRLPENFNNPYKASSIQDFWQRWHISLSSWIRDYIYIPLGGNRLGLSRKIVNGVIAFALCGLWHGAGWNFVLWGLWHGVGLAVNSTYKIWLGSVGYGFSVMLVKVLLLSWLITFTYVAFGWLLFFYEPQKAWAITCKLLGIN